jgi:hypothetical protein
MGYLYGAAVQGIQGFIFETNRLREIIGASEIVEYISTQLFKKFIDNDVEIILSAAGNIKLFSRERQGLEKLVRIFPKTVMETAPGITISQAVVALNQVETGDQISSAHINLLEDKLKSERNRAVPQMDVSGLAIKRAPRTGKSAVYFDREFIDNSTRAKLNFEKEQTTLIQKLAKEPGKKFSKNIVDISGVNSWVAVIHADGNSLGRTIQRMNNARNEFNVKQFSEFSEKLDRSTIGAAQAAFNAVIEKDFQESKRSEYQIRPVILGGDDLTVICRADLALNFTQSYLKNFQDLTAFHFGENNRITACAGIAFIKDSFPFHYGINLAEQLCAFAKLKSKEANDDRIPASLMFHKVHSSFVDDYGTITKRELTAKNCSLQYGPYGIDDPEHNLPASIKNLQETIRLIKEPCAPKSGLRKWLSALHDDPSHADFLLTRIREITPEKYVQALGLENQQKEDRTIFHDVLAICSMEENEHDNNNMQN